MYLVKPMWFICVVQPMWCNIYVEQSTLCNMCGADVPVRSRDMCFEPPRPWGARNKRLLSAGGAPGELNVVQYTWRSLSDKIYVAQSMWCKLCSEFYGVQTRGGDDVLLGAPGTSTASSVRPRELETDVSAVPENTWLRNCEVRRMAARWTAPLRGRVGEQ